MNNIVLRGNLSHNDLNIRQCMKRIRRPHKNVTCRNFEFSIFKVGYISKQDIEIQVGAYCLSILKIETCPKHQIVKTQVQIIKAVYTYLIRVYIQRGATRTIKSLKFPFTYSD